MADRNTTAMILAVGIAVLGFAVVPLLPNGSGARRDQLAALFRLPDDVTWTVFDSPTGRYGLRHTEAIIEFTPEQWDTYVAALDDTMAWNPSGLTFHRTTIPEQVDLSALRWHEGEYAVMTDEFACFWVDWGHYQGKETGGKPTVWKSRAWRSLCWAVLDDGGRQQVVPCRGIKHTPPGLKLYARAKLDAENRRMFAFVR